MCTIDNIVINCKLFLQICLKKQDILLVESSPTHIFSLKIDKYVNQ